MTPTGLAGADLRSLVLMPALVTLAVTLLRLTGELLHWSERFFSRAAGGAFAVVGIVWLVPIFGVIFGLRLARTGHPAPRASRAILAGVLGVLALPLLVTLWALLGLPPVAQVLAFCIGYAVVAWFVAKSWPALAKALFTYGLLARIPVAVIMLIAIFANWGTHYELGRPDLPPLEPPLVKWLVIGFAPQFGLWVSFTVIVGLLCGAIAAAVASRRRA
jgi:predicted membrane channel-forming protein YqfA (hemolysin III family)